MAQPMDGRNAAQRNKAAKETKNDFFIILFLLFSKVSNDKGLFFSRDQEKAITKKSLSECEVLLGK
jgi:hypothetical protein